jgi:hypothetical protein
MRVLPPGVDPHLVCWLPGTLVSKSSGFQWILGVKREAGVTPAPLSPPPARWGVGGRGRENPRGRSAETCFPLRRNAARARATGSPLGCTEPHTAMGTAKAHSAMEAPEPPAGGPPRWILVNPWDVGPGTKILFNIPSRLLASSPGGAWEYTSFLQTVYSKSLSQICSTNLLDKSVRKSAPVAVWLKRSDF